MLQRLFIFLLSVVAAVAVAQPESDSDLILILDASNSMWGQIDGINKIVIARESVGQLISDLDEQSRIGLIAYGHRREGDCADIEVLRRPVSGDKAALISTINSINPRGHTPLASSIETAIEVAAESDNSSIVLISDGLETCDLDPCAAVATAKASDVPFVLHVVGLDVAGEDTTQLECMAQTGDGLFFPANDAGELSAALQSAYEKPTVPDGRLIVTVTAEGALQDALISVVDVETGDPVASGRTYVSAETNPRRLPLDDGRYSATVSAVGIRGSQVQEFDFEISGGSAFERAFDFGAGDLAVLVTRDGELSDAVVNVRIAEDRTNVAGGRTYRADSSNPRVFRITAGTYDVTIRSVELATADEHLFGNIVVEAGERTDLSHEFVSGTLRVGVSRSDTLVDSVVAIVDQSGRSVAGGRTYTNEQSNPITEVLPPGDYRVDISEIRGEERSLSVTVSQRETTEILIDLDQAQ